MLPSIFGESLFDDWMDFPFRGFSNDVDHKLYGKNAARVMKTDLKELIRKSVPDPKVELSESELLELLPRWENNGSVKNSRCSIDLSVVHSILEKKFLRI